MIVTDDNKHQMLEHLASEKVFSLDTETTGLDWDDRAFAVVIATKSKVFYMEHWDFLKHLHHLPLEVIMINAKFDMRMINLPFYSPWNIRDVGIFERVLKNDGISLASYSLEAIAKRRGVGEKSDIVENYIKAYSLYEERTTKYTGETYKNKRFDQVDRNILREYALLDARLTFDIYQDQLKSTDEEDMRVFNNECDLIHCTYKMEMDGIKVDQEYTEKALLWEAEKLEEAKERFKEFSGLTYKDTKSLLVPYFEKHGEKIKYTAKGNPSLTNDDLESFTSPAAKFVQDIRYHEKRISTYFTSYLDLADSNSFIHPNIVQHGTATGRFSYAKPNLQNCSKDEPDENPYTVRGCFVPESKKNIFLSLDYAQQEYRLMLDYANEIRVIREVLAGKDVHQAIADAVRISRHFAKKLNFIFLYGGGPQRIAEMLGISVREAKKLRDEYFLALPKVDKFISDVIGVSRKRGYVRNWLGRKLRNKYDFGYKAPNHLIQGGCGDIIKVAMVDIFKHLKSTNIKMRLQVHDQLVFEGEEEELRENYTAIKNIMESSYKPMNGMILTTDASYSEESFAERTMKKWN